MKNQHINRRDFLNIVGITAATTTAALYGCAPKDQRGSGSKASSPVPTDQMTYRTFPGLGDKVSLLGYGCMRWPTIPSPDGKGDLIDQDAVNELVDYAIAHGVNYFDTSPVYVQGWSERLRELPLAGIPGTRIIWLPNCRISRTIRVKTRWRCTAVHSASCKPIIWIIICSTPSVAARE